MSRWRVALDCVKPHQENQESRVAYNIFRRGHDKMRCKTFFTIVRDVYAFVDGAETEEEAETMVQLGKTRGEPRWVRSARRANILVAYEFTRLR